MNNDTQKRVKVTLNLSIEAAEKLHAFVGQVSIPNMHGSGIYDAYDDLGVALREAKLPRYYSSFGTVYDRHNTEDGSYVKVAQFYGDGGFVEARNYVATLNEQ